MFPEFGCAGDDDPKPKSRFDQKNYKACIWLAGLFQTDPSTLELALP
jgi:hypothetical protein